MASTASVEGLRHQRLIEEGDGESGYHHSACDYYCHEEQEMAASGLTNALSDGGVLGRSLVLIVELETV